jgi:type II secretory pathway pseudopilin PulG
MQNPLQILARHTKQRGFALIVTLSLMILLTVIAVGLLQLSAISLRTSSQGDARALARSNAMMALQMAIGQLQRTAGQDQRITGPAELASSQYPAAWTGVWTPGAVNATGLVPPIAPTTDDRKNYLVDARVQAANTNWKSKWFIEALVSPGKTNSKRVDVELGTWSQTEKVRLPEVDVGTTGTIAWWTQDLSQQASLASGVNAADAVGVGLSAAPRVDSSQLTGRGLPIDYFTASTDRRKVTSLQGAYLAGGKPGTGNLGDSGTERSYGLFTDPVKGGFKADMTRFVGAPVATAPAVMGQLPAMGLTGITAKSSILPGSHHLRTGPQWERLRYWYNLPGAANRRLTGTNPAVVLAVPPTTVPDSPGAVAREGSAVDAVRSNSMPLHPVVVDAGFHWDFTPIDTVASKIRVHILPRLTLWNPYNATLACRRYVFAMPKQIDGGGGLTVNFSLPADPPDYVQVLGTTGEQFRPPTSSDTTFLDSKDSYFMFTVPATTFGPGECLVFTPSAPANKMSPYDSNDPANNMLTASQPVGLENFYFDKDPLGAIAPTPATPATSTTPATPATPRIPGLSERLAAGATVKSYHNGARDGKQLNWRAMPFFLKAAPRSGALSATDVLRSSAYPTLQRLFLTLAGGGQNPGWIYVFPDENNHARNTGSAWGVFDPATHIPPRAWNYRHHLSWIADDVEKAAGIGSQPPYNTALMADWNPLASVACRTPSTFIREFVDLHTGCWYLCKAAYDAYGPNSNWGWFDNINNKARGCPYDDPLKHKSELSFPLIDIPDPSLPLQSIGTLRNVPLSPWTWHPVKPIGSSRTSLHSDKAATAIPAIAALQNPWTSILSPVGLPKFDDVIQSADSTNEILLYDLAFEANRELWDGTFASSWSQTAAWNGTDPLPNRQYVAHPQLRDATRVRTLADSSQNTYGLWLPAYLLANEGAFNVNSTSPTAWKAVLGGLKNLVRSDVTGTPAAGDHPFAKFRKPASSDSTWGGGLGLSDAQMATLADRIVDVVKERGPFLGMADFINRRLATDTSGNRGALEEALIRANLANTVLTASIGTPNDDGTLVSGANRGRYQNASTHLMEGAAGYIEQADLLEPLGGALCARGDTFRIRATGASYDKSGKLLSRVTCEAIVVRSPDYLIADAIDQAGSPTTGNSALIPPTIESGAQRVPNPALNPINQKFGRRFEVLNIKWLTSVNEI